MNSRVVPFRVKGDTVDIYLAYADHAYRISFWGDEIESIEYLDPWNNRTSDRFEKIKIYPANIFVTTKDTLNRSIKEIQDDLVKQVDYFEDLG